MKTLVKAVSVLALSAASLSAFALTNADRYGEAASPVAAERTIVIGPNTRSVNVNHGEVVKFVVNGQEFAWDFDGVAHPFDLSKIAPEGTLDHSVTVYVGTSLQDGGFGD